MSREQLLQPIERWSTAKKRAVVLGVRNGTITQGEALKAHRISTDEFIAWWLEVERRSATSMQQGC